MQKRFKKYKKVVFRILALALSFSLIFQGSALAGSTMSVYSIPNSSLQIRYQSQFTNMYPTSEYSTSSRFYYIFDFPVPISLSTTNGGVVGKYFTGIVTFYIDLTVSTGVISSNNNYSFMFPDYNQQGYSVGARVYDNSHAYVYFIFDNYLMDFSSVPGPSDWLYRFTGSNEGLFQASLSVTIQNGSDSVSVSTSPNQDLASVIAAGINQSTDIQHIFDTLAVIQNNTALLSQVISKLDNLNTILQKIYTHVLFVDDINENLYMLVSALAGVELEGQTVSGLTQAMYDHWVEIIKSSLDSISPSTGELESQVSSAGDMVADYESQEQVITDNMNSAISDVDLSPVSPAGVAGAAPTFIAWVLSLWNGIGNLQYVVVVSLTIGLALLILGSISRYRRKH